MNRLVVKTRLASDGTIRATVMYSMRAGEWAEAKAQLVYQLDQPRGQPVHSLQ